MSHQEPLKTANLEDLEFELREIKRELIQLNQTCEALQAELVKRSWDTNKLLNNTGTSGAILAMILGVLCVIGWQLI